MNEPKSIARELGKLRFAIGRYRAEQIGIATLLDVYPDSRADARNGILAAVEAICSTAPRKEIAARWGVSESTICRWLKIAKCNDGSPVNIGRNPVFGPVSAKYDPYCESKS